MMAGMYAAISGLDANQAMLNDTASNLANVNTVGYKASSVTFADSLTQVIRGASGPTITNGGSNPVQIGLGVQVDATRNEMTEGSFQTTNNPLDIAIEGTGFLRVGIRRTAGQRTVHRWSAGQPRVHAGGRPDDQHEGVPHHAGRAVRDRPQRGRHRNRSRHHLRARRGRHLHPDPPGLDQHLDRAGRLGRATPTTTPNRKPTSSGSTAGYLSLATFPNEGGLERVGGSLWAQTANSGGPIVGTPATVGFGMTIGGELEMSNVDLATEMTKMITAERGYQANSRMITTADTMLQTLVQMQ